jgi:ABC-2 type transport system permease protein
MRNVLAITGKELRTYFVSPVAYVVTAGFLLMMGIFFAAFVIMQAPYSQNVSLGPVLGNAPIILLLLAPALTMRLLAEETRSGTMELMLTSPVRDGEVVLGKYLASLLFFLFMLALTLVYPLVLMRFGNPDRGLFLSSYLGAALFGAAFLAVGVLASALTQNQIVAAVISLATLLALWLIDMFATLTRGPLADILNYLSIIARYNDFLRGVISSQSVIYYLSVIAVALFLATRALETRRWA